MKNFKYTVLDMVAALMGSSVDDVLTPTVVEKIVVKQMDKSYETALVENCDKGTVRAYRIGGTDRAFGYHDGFNDCVKLFSKFLNDTNNESVV